MWKVKRMNTARIVVLTIAIGAGGIAAYLASGSDDKPAPAPAGRAAADRRYSRRQIRYRPRPVGQARRSAMADLAGRDRQQQLHQPRQQGRRHQGDHRLDRARAVHRGRADSRAEAGEGRRLRLHGGDPARRLSGPSRPKFRRKPAPAASSCRTTASTCFLPSATRARTARRPDVVNSEIILSNIRVLAIDQAPKEKDGTSALVGKTVTLELKPEQTETLARARQSGTLSLALRSIADVKTVEKHGRPTSTGAAKTSTSFVTASPASRRCRSDRKDARYEVQGKSADDADIHRPRPVVFGRRCAHAQSGLTPVVASDYRAAASGGTAPPTDR